jgi:signal transduction histidine kinase
MKDRHQRTAFVISDTDSVERVLTTELHCTLSLLSYEMTTTPPVAAELASESTIDGLQICHQISQMLSDSADLKDALSQILALVGQAFQVDGCAIVPSVPAQGLTQGLSWWADGGSRCCQFTLPPTIGDALLTLTGGTIINIASTTNSGTDSEATDPAIEPLLELWQAAESGESSSPQAILALRMQFQGQVNGLVSLMRREVHVWTDAEVAGLSQICQEVTIALANWQLQQQLTQHQQFQAVLNQLTLAIRNSVDLNEIQAMAIDKTAAVLKVERAVLLRLRYSNPLYKSGTHNQSLKAKVSVAHEWLSRSEAPDPEAPGNLNQPASLNLPGFVRSFWMPECALCQQAFAASSALIAAKWETLSLEAAKVAPVFDLAHLPALVLTPLKSQGMVLGFLLFQDDRPREWQPAEIELIELVGAQITTAIVQTETLRQVQALAEKRTAELQDSLSIQAKLYEKTRQQIDQLRHLNRLKDEFLSTISHELRTPLTSMMMAIRMLRQTGTFTDRSTRYLNILEQQCAQETNLINDLLALQELESKQIQVQPENIDLKVLITELTASLQQNFATRELILDLDLPKSSLKLQTERDSLSRILSELLTNAIKYAAPNSHISLRATLLLQPTNSIVLTLCNLGMGISPLELPQIFDKFHRSQAATAQAIQGTGLGLALVKSLVEYLGGTIAASSCEITNSECYETCFTLTLPQTLSNS